MQFLSKSILVFLLLSTSSFFAQSLVVDAGVDLTICTGESTPLGGTPTASGGTGPYSYSWSPANVLRNDTLPNPTTISLAASTLFYLTVTDDLGASSTDSIFVYVDAQQSCYELIFYNLFTPNKDGVNDVWTIINCEKYPQNTLEVFNRYGKSIYKANPYTNNWDGKGLSDDMPAATYYYVFDPGTGAEVRKGSVTIIR